MKRQEDFEPGDDEDEDEDDEYGDDEDDEDDEDEEDGEQGPILTVRDLERRLTVMISQGRGDFAVEVETDEYVHSFFRLVEDKARRKLTLMTDGA